MQKVAQEVVAELKSEGGGNVREQVGYRMTTKLTDYLLGLDETNRPDFKYLIGQAMLTNQHLTADRASAARRAYEEFVAPWSARILSRGSVPIG